MDVLRADTRQYRQHALDVSQLLSGGRQAGGSRKEPQSPAGATAWWRHDHLHLHALISVVVQHDMQAPDAPALLWEAQRSNCEATLHYWQEQRLYFPLNSLPSLMRATRAHE